MGKEIARTTWGGGKNRLDPPAPKAHCECIRTNRDQWELLQARITSLSSRHSQKLADLFTKYHPSAVHDGTVGLSEQVFGT